MKKATMKDIAKLANVSVATVSYVLNNATNQTIPEHTRSLILNIAKELNYIPNLAARSLINKKSGLIGILINKEDNQPYWKSLSYSSFVNRLENQLTKAGYHTLLISLDSTNPSLDVIVERKLDAVFLIDVKDELFYNISTKFTEGIPLILLDSLIDDKLFNYIIYDYETAIAEALKSIDGSTMLVIEDFCNKALVKEIQLLSGLPAEHIFIAKNMKELEHFAQTSTFDNIVVINEFISNYLYQTNKFKQIVTICSCYCPEILPSTMDKISFEADRSVVAFQLMEKLITDHSYKPFESNKFLIKVVK